MRFDGIFLDMYGTITTGDKAAVEAVCTRIVQDTGLSISPPALAITWGERFFAAMDTCNNGRFQTLFEVEATTLVDTLTDLGTDVDPAMYIADLSAYWRAPALQPEARTFFDQCPLPVCIVSNADRADIDAAVEYHGLDVAGIVTSEETRSYKPDTRIFSAALEQMGWWADRVVHVGDSLHSDVGGARAAGIASAWVNRAHRIHDIGTLDPDYELTDLMDLLPIVAG